MNIVEFTETLVKAIVKHPDMVKASEFGAEEESIILEIIVSSEDMGAVIGKGGKMASALRTLIQAHAYINNNKKVKINIDSF